MEPSPEEQQLLRACAILFGSDLHIRREFLEYLQLSGLKSAYRKRALETHPDRGLDNDRFLRRGNHETFHGVRKAYEDLLSFLHARESRRLRAGSNRPRAADFTPAPPQSERSSARPAPFPHDAHCDTGYSATENLYHGPMPHRRLLFGHFLYYSGLANWRTITRILTWQRTERPRFGELGQRLGMLTPEDITLILRSKVPFQPFGQTAQALGLLSAQQLRVLIFHQQRLQKKFGIILLEKDLINRQELQSLLFQFERHNAGIARNVHSISSLSSSEFL